MKALRWIPAAVALMACGGRGYVLTLAEPAPITLPIEVLGARGAERTIELHLTAEIAQAATTLNLRTHRVNRSGKATIQINDGSWTPLSNGSVSVAEPGSSFGGIGGGFATLALELALPAGTLREGMNTVRFRFSAAPDGCDVGYRVLSFNLLNDARQPLMGSQRFAHDDPRTWKPLTSDADELQKGAHLWSTASLLTPTGRRLACRDCHTHDGRDLAYFAYSNTAIIESAQRWGLSPSDGERIASYIRSLKVLPWGRPWNPPYQPGPELDLRPLASWAAGAGVDAALSRDVQALPFLFREGISAEAVATSNRLNLRELPVVLQLPDWNHWLPPVHPAQVWGEAFTNHPAFTRYQGIRQRLVEGGKDYARGAMPADLESWANAWNSDFVNEVTRGLDAWPAALSIGLYAGARWRMVKLWELMQEFDLEGVGAELYAPVGESRTWFSRTGFAANTAPSRNHPFDPTLENAPLVSRSYESAWRHLGLVLNPGNRRRFSFTPFSFPDALGDLHLLNDHTDVPELTRFLAVMVKGFQEMDNGLGPAAPLEGWSLSDVVWIWALTSPTFEPLWKDVSTAQRLALTEAILQAWWTTHGSFPVETWPRGTGRHQLPPESYRPTVDQPASTAVDELYLALPRLRALGINPALLDEIRGWGARMWPNGMW